MSDFDRRLRSRLQRLEESVPDPQPLALSEFRRSGRQRRRQAVLLLAATIGLLSVTSLAALAMRPPPDPAQEAKNAAEEGLVLQDLATQEDGSCRSSEDAVALFQHRLNALGLDHWSIRDDGRTLDAPCISGGVIGDSQEILLMASMGGRVASALDELALDLLQTCHNRDEAMERLRGTLVQSGIPEPQISVGRVRAVPSDSAGEYLEQLGKGCYLYAGANPNQTGRYSWYVAGR